MQFGRILACHLLNQKEKLNWKDCVLQHDKEAELAKSFRLTLTAKK